VNSTHTIYHLARADLLERIRRYSFLVMLGAAVFLGSQIAVNNLGMQLDEYRGEINSAWVGSLMSLMGTFFIGWFGFYLVKGSIAHDRKTGVGQIMAATPLTRFQYLFGKWGSHFAVLTILNLILVITGIGILLLAGENTQFNLFTMLAPFFFITLPTMALIAAVAVLFESIRFLSGGFGNVVYFFLFVIASDSLDKSRLAFGFDPTGMGIFRRSLWAAAEAAYPQFNGGFVIDIQSRLEPVQYIFPWSGVDWTLALVLQRFGLIGIALLLMVVAGKFFDRFEIPDYKRSRAWRKRKAIPTPVRKPDPAVSNITPVQLTPLQPAAKRFIFINLLDAELKNLLSGPRWWWFAVALVLVLAGGVFPPAFTRATLLPLAWVWPISVWSNMGNREIKHNVQQLAFSSAFPLWRQLPAQWLAGFMITFGIGFGAFLGMSMGGDMQGLAAFLSAAIFIPSLALASGVWSASNKLFEVLYIFIWYFGPINHLLGLDYIGTQGSGRPAFFALLSGLLIALAIFGRKRQISS